MSRVYECVGEYAKTPYYFDKTFVNVYSMEELCYCLVQNASFLEKDIMDKRLINWINEECGLKDLSRELYSLFNQDGSAVTFVDMILECTGYCDAAQRKEVCEILRAGIDLDVYEKKKARGDYLLKNRKYSLALGVYSDLEKEVPRERVELLESLYRNKGMTYARLFALQFAADYFWKAYEIGHSKELLMLYLYAMRIQLEEEDYLKHITVKNISKEVLLEAEDRMKLADATFETTDESRMLSTMRIRKAEGDTRNYYSDLDNLVIRLKEDYRSLVSGE